MPDLDADAIPDDRLRLIFTCCHPALSPEAQIALTLRLVCGLATPDVARALLVAEATMAARLTRAKRKIATARIPYVVPSAADLPERLDAVLTVIHLLYASGHTAYSGAELMRDELSERALDLARMLRVLMPDEREAAGLLALLLVHHARRATRTDAQGALLRLEDQDRSELGPRADRRGRPAARRRAARRAGRALHAAGGDRGAARAGAELRGDRLAADPDALRRAAAGVAFARRRAEPRGGAVDGRRPGGGAGRGGGVRARPAAGRLPLPPRDEGGSAPSPRPQRGGRRRLRAAHELSDNAAERDFLAERVRETSTQPSR